MKKLLAVLFIGTTVFASCDKESIISKTELPEVSQTFINTNFADLAINRIEKDKDSYDVNFINGYEIEFDKSGNWDNIDCLSTEIPASVLALIPSEIVSYVSANYPTNVIVEINKEFFGYEIGLNNDLDLRFDTEGNFQGIEVDN